MVYNEHWKELKRSKWEAPEISSHCDNSDPVDNNFAFALAN